MSMIHFSVQIAKNIGHEAAIVYSILCHYSHKNSANKGDNLSYISLDKICVELPFWNCNKIIEILNILALHGYVEPKIGDMIFLKGRDEK